MSEMESTEWIDVTDEQLAELGITREFAVALDRWYKAQQAFGDADSFTLAALLSMIRLAPADYLESLRAQYRATFPGAVVRQDGSVLLDVQSLKDAANLDDDQAAEAARRAVVVGRALGLWQSPTELRAVH